MTTSVADDYLNEVSARVDSLASPTLSHSPVPEPCFRVSDFIELCNQNLEYAFTGVIVEGEVASFKVNQGKWVFFDLKEDEYTVGCFMALSQLTVPLTDGMKVRVRATPKLTRWGKFSLTIHRILPLGEGNIKKSFELLKQKLTAEGLFDPAKKRPLSENLTKIGVISSTAAAGYIDFLKILDNRWGGLGIYTINTQVQGLSAAEQIIRALQYFNERGDVDVIAILRGGGSADDLAVFNDEQLVRAVAASRIPTIAGIGHEIDESLVDLAADIRASTPSNAAERLTPDRQATISQVRSIRTRLTERIEDKIALAHAKWVESLKSISREFSHRLDLELARIRETAKVLASLSPENTLKRGYAIVTGKLSPGSVVKITTYSQTLTAEIKTATERKNNRKEV